MSGRPTLAGMAGWVVRVVLDKAATPLEAKALSQAGNFGGAVCVDADADQTEVQLYLHAADARAVTNDAITAVCSACDRFGVADIVVIGATSDAERSGDRGGFLPPDVSPGS